MRNPFKTKDKIARTFLVHTEAGYAHRNEDTAIVQTHLDDSDILICVLADGQGGQAGGATASRTVVDKCLELTLAQSAKRRQIA